MHRSPDAAAVTEDLNAKAVTRGDDILLARDAPQPESQAGDRRTSTRHPQLHCSAGIALPRKSFDELTKKERYQIALDEAFQMLLRASIESLAYLFLFLVVLGMDVSQLHIDLRPGRGLIPRLAEELLDDAREGLRTVGML